MAQAKKRDPVRKGCGIAIAVGAALTIALGLYFGQREQEARTPCEEYARTIHTSLDNCHSGVNRDRVHHREVCEESLNVTQACLDDIERFSRRDCRELERRVQNYLFCRE